MSNLLKNILGVLVFSLLSVNTFSQDFVSENVKYINGSGFDNVSDICLDNKLNLYITGTFEKDGTIENNTIKASNSNSMFFAKYDKEGVLLWHKQIGGKGEVNAKAITVDSRNNLYLTGTFKKSCTFEGQTIKSSDYQDNFVAKYNSEGKLQWVKHVLANTKDENIFLTCDNKDNLYFSGNFYKTLSVDNIKITSKNGTDIFILKFNTEGEFTKSLTIGGKNSDKLEDVKCNNKGNIFITGSFTNDINFLGNPLVAEGREDAFLAKIENLDIKTPLVWLKQIGSYYTDKGKSLFLQDDKIFLAGNFSYNVKFRKANIASNGMQDVFVSCYTTKGRELWTSSFGGAGNDYANSVVVSKNSNIYVTGSFKSEIKIGKTAIEATDFKSDNFIIKMNKAGEFQRMESFGGTDSDYSVKTIISEENVIYHTGTYRTDFNIQNFRSKIKSKNDIFLASIYDCDNTELELGDDVQICGDTYLIKADTNFVSYLWSNGSTKKDAIVNETGAYTLTVTDKFGCSATNDIEITLNPIPTIDLGKDLIVIKGNTVNINAETGFESYQWTSINIAENLETSGEVLTINSDQRSLFQKTKRQ